MNVNDDWTPVAPCTPNEAPLIPRNRAERRDYNRHVFTGNVKHRRLVRMHIVGFGRWRRHRYLTRRMDAS